MSIVKFENVSKKYYGKTALDNVSFELPSGKVVGLIGPNGSGKSTALKLMAGLIRSNKGAVTVCDKPARRRISEEVAFLSELDAFYPFFTVQETINFYHEQYRDFDLDKAESMLKFMELKPDVRVKDLSKGNRGRLKIVLTMSRCARLILMDEPLSGLDPIVRESIIKSLVSFIDLEQQTIIMTTHEVSEIEPLLDMVVAIRDGHVLKIEEIDDIREEHNISLVEWMKKVFV